MAYYLHYQHPTVTRGLVAGGFTCTDEAEGRYACAGLKNYRVSELAVREYLGDLKAAA